MTALMRVVAAALVTAIGAVLLVLLDSAGPAAASTYSVAMTNYAFSPSVLTVHVGDTVTWTNNDQAPHNVTTTAAPVAINGATIGKGQSWTYTFRTAGTYAYICSVHPDMHARVVVLDATPTVAHHPSTPHSAATSHSATMPYSAVMSHSTVAAAAKAKPTATTATPMSSMTPAPASDPSTAAAVAVSSSGGVTTARLKPLLLVAGLVAAVTILCLLAYTSRSATDPHQP